MNESGRILVVEDEPQIRRVLHSILVKQGCDVLLVARGDKALEFVRSESFDVVLLDLNLPDMAGDELCRTIRTASDTAIIVLTVRSDLGDKIALLNAGADDYVTKPFDAGVLLARIRANMRRHAAKDKLGSFTAQDLFIDFDKRTVTRGEKKWHLSRKEYQLLRYLVSHRGESLSHGALLGAIWGPDFGEETGILQVTIMQLRKKIERDPSQPRYIITIPWFGYRFEVPEEPQSYPSLLPLPS